MIKKEILLFCFLLIALLGKSQIDSTEYKAYHYKTKHFDIAVFPDIFRTFSKVSFTPSHLNVLKAEYALNKQLVMLSTNSYNKPKIETIHKNLNKYFRQYFGYIDENGNKILWINCTRKHNTNEFHEEWLKNIIYVNDGGINYWNVKYNIDTGKLFELYINGDA